MCLCWFVGFVYVNDKMLLFMFSSIVLFCCFCFKMFIVVFVFLFGLFGVYCFYLYGFCDVYGWVYLFVMIVGILGFFLFVVI